MLIQIISDTVYAIKRVIAPNSYIIKTEKQGIQLLTIDDLKSKQFSLTLLLEAKEWYDLNSSDSLQFQINSSDIVIATTQNERTVRGTFKTCLKVMKVKVAKM